MTYADAGKKVWALYGGRFVPVIVACSMGHTVRIRNDVLGIDTWADVSELREAPPK